MQKNNFKFLCKSFLGFPIYLWLIIIFLSITKLWLVAGQHVFAIGGAGHDDRLFINLANNLLHSNWLGNYNNLTLAKGPFYPIWIAFSYVVHIPLFYSQHLLYILGCIILVISFKSILEKRWHLLILFTVILFNPMSFTDGPATRVIREGIYPALAILVIALFAGILLRTKSSLKKMLLWSLGAGIALSCFWLTREEGIWIIPFTILITLYSIFIVWKEKSDGWKVKIAIIILPFIILYASITTISTINYYKYGIFNTVEFNSPAFLNAYGALNRVKPTTWIPYLPVSAAQRQIIYPISPAFSELKPFLEGDLGKNWAKNRSQPMNPSDAVEIQGGWFMWAFRDAVAQAGTSSTTPVYRLYNPNTGDHFYTTSESEKISLEKILKTPIVSEGIAFYSYSDGSAEKESFPVYKFYNSNGDFYFYTSSDTKNNQLSVNSKTIAFYASPTAQNGALPVYDFYITNNKHFYTISEAEKDGIVKTPNSSYKLEGIAFYSYSYPQGGYYTKGKLAMDYYQRLANEINSACDSGKIACYKKRSTMMPPWNKNYNIPTLNYIYQGLLYTIKFDGFNATPSTSIGDESSLKLFNKITWGDVNKKENTFKVSILNNIGKVYAFVSPIATILALFIFLFQLINIKKSYKNFKFILSFAIATSFFARIIGLALINATSFPTINTLYLSSAYPSLLLFILLNFSILLDLIKQLYHK